MTGSIKRVTNSISSILQFSKVSFWLTLQMQQRQGKANLDDKELLKQKMEFVVNNEKTPVPNIVEFYDQFVDEEYNLESAIIGRKSKEVRMKNIHNEWSGQDIIPAIEPYKAGIIINDLSSIRVYRRDILRPAHIIRESIRTLVESAFCENFMTL